MRPDLRYFRWFLVTSLSLSLVGGEFRGPRAHAACPINASVTQTKNHCCCEGICQCDSPCCSESTPEQSQSPTKSTNRDACDLVKTAAAIPIMVADLPLGHQICKPTSLNGDEIHPSQSLVEQHTCLQV